MLVFTAVYSYSDYGFYIYTQDFIWAEVNTRIVPSKYSRDGCECSLV